MKSPLDYIYIILVLICVSCNNNNVTTVRVFSDDFINVETLKGKDIELDTIPGICGCVIPIDSLYFCYLYRSDNYLMITDRDFNIKGYTAHRGSGPNEVSQISFLYGNILNDARFAVLDIDKRTVYGGNLDNWTNFDSKLNLTMQKDIPAPIYLQQLNNGKFLMAHMDFEYGLFTYNQIDDTVDYWPVGLELPENKKYEISSGRGLTYNRANDIVAEYYSILPILILHGADGDVLRTIQYADMPRLENLNEDSPSMIKDICLTDNYIYALWGGCDSGSCNKDESSIYITCYSGNPIACLIIKQASTISIDEENHRLIAVNPNAENNITVYNLPDCVK